MRKHRPSGHITRDVRCAVRRVPYQAPPDESEEEGLKEFAKFEKQLVGNCGTRTVVPFSAHAPSFTRLGAANPLARTPSVACCHLMMEPHRSFQPQGHPAARPRFMRLTHTSAAPLVALGPQAGDEGEGSSSASAPPKEENPLAAHLSN